MTVIQDIGHTFIVIGIASIPSTIVAFQEYRTTYSNNCEKVNKIDIKRYYSQYRA